MAEEKSKEDAQSVKTVVIIEDEEALLELLRVKLERRGLRVLAARDGISGLDLIRQEKPALLLLDMLIPRLDGMHVLENMKAEGLLPGIPVLIISNSGQPVEIERAMTLGAADYLIKVNFDPQEVIARAEMLLGGHPTDRAPERSGGRGQKHILIVEDDELLSGLLNHRFTEAGFAAHTARDADQARRLLAETDMDVILLDLVLPGMDGFTFLAALKQNPRAASIPIIIISNLGQKEEIDKGMRLGAADYIVKANISPNEIVEKVAAIIRHKK